jgi:hypothetical protein
MSGALQTKATSSFCSFGFRLTLSLSAFLFLLFPSDDAAGEGERKIKGIFKNAFLIANGHEWT